MKRTIENYKTRKYYVLYSWYSNGQKWYDTFTTTARTKKAVYPRLMYNPDFESRSWQYSGTVQIEKVTWIRPPKPGVEENA